MEGKEVFDDVAPRGDIVGGAFWPTNFPLFQAALCSRVSMTHSLLLIGAGFLNSLRAGYRG